MPRPKVSNKVVSFLICLPYLLLIIHTPIISKTATIAHVHISLSFSVWDFFCIFSIQFIWVFLAKRLQNYNLGSLLLQIFLFYAELVHLFFFAAHFLYEFIRRIKV